MSDIDRRRAIHDLDATLRVGKGGVDSVADELATQLEERDLVKVKFLRAARGGTDTETLAADLADASGATVVETRGHTAVFER
jgi:RNA-binding protein